MSRLRPGIVKLHKTAKLKRNVYIFSFEDDIMFANNVTRTVSSSLVINVCVKSFIPIQIPIRYEHLVTRLTSCFTLALMSDLVILNQRKDF